jgi:hypothetical protein
MKSGLHKANPDHKLELDKLISSLNKFNYIYYLGMQGVAE